MPKLKLGAVAYGAVAVLMVIELVMILQRRTTFAEVPQPSLVVAAVVVAATGVLFAIGAITRWGLIADDGPWICEHGWVLLAGVTLLGLVGAFWNGLDDIAPLWPAGPAIFVPHWIRRSQEKYYEGIAEGERELLSRAAPGEAPRSTS
jgi:hypothetical protein